MNALARVDEPIHPHGGHAAGGRAKPVTRGAAAVSGVGAELADRGGRDDARSLTRDARLRLRSPRR